MDRVLLIDGLNQIYRACVSFGPTKHHIQCNLSEENACLHKANGSHCMCNAKWNVEEQWCYGDKFSFIFNFFRNIRPLVEAGSPDKIFFVLEGHPQFRYDLFPEYKGNRIIKLGSKQDAKDKFNIVKNEIIRLLQYLPITIARAEHYEADDLISTLVDNMKEEDLTIITNDNDYVQLLQRNYKHITIFNPIKKEIMESPKWNFIPFKALVGDKSDNLPRLVSDKKAAKYMSDPDAFQIFMANNEHRSKFHINRELIEFRNVPEEEIILKDGQRNFVELKKEFIRMDFQSIVNESSWQKYIDTFSCVKY